MTITKEMLKQVRVEIDAAVAVIAAKHGITLRAGNATFSENGFTMKVEGRVVGAPSEEETHFRNYAHMYGIDPEWLNQRVLYAKREFILRGTKRLKVILESNGKPFTANVADFKRGATLLTEVNA